MSKVKPSTRSVRAVPPATEPASSTTTSSEGSRLRSSHAAVRPLMPAPTMTTRLLMTDTLRDHATRCETGEASAV